VVLIECGFGWLPALGWRLDKHWKRLREEVPHLTRAPSEYIREHFYVTTQPMEEADDPSHVLDAMRWIGIERILFASDYPHWDFDDPVMAIPPSLAANERQAIFGGNARKLFGLD
jgi:predicted TIM-barrel fold metal-dependent hydrolase